MDYLLHLLRRKYLYKKDTYFCKKGAGLKSYAFFFYCVPLPDSVANCEKLCCLFLIISIRGAMQYTDVTHEKITYLFVKFGEGDEKAFSFFYKYFMNDLYAYGRSLGATEVHVMDVVQDVFVNVFFDKPQLKSVEHFKYFLLKSLKNRLYDLFKSKSFSKTEDINEEVLAFSIKTTVLDEIIEEEDRIIIEQKIEKLLSVLSPLQKEALYLGNI